MIRRALLILVGFFVAGSTAWAVISAASPLKNILADNPYIFVAKVDTIDAKTPAMVLNIDQDLKGKFDFRRLPVVIKTGDEDAEKFKHVPQLMKRIAPGTSMVWFVQHRGKRVTAFAFTNGTWMQILGETVGKERVVCTFTHLEPNLRQTFKGTTEELIAVVKDGLSGKKAPPELNEKEPPGFGPEVRGRAGASPAPLAWMLPQRLRAGETPALRGSLFAVIPTLGIAGPLAILAILFPTVFGGVLILFRQWTAFITAFSFNSTIMMLYWWKGGVWFRGSWWITAPGQWLVLSVVTALCFWWAWRRQLANLSQGADALDTPPRTEYLVLGVLSITCVGFVLGTWFFDEDLNKSDIIWNYTLVLTVSALIGLIYKIYRGLVEVMLPMATEGVMLGAAMVAHMAVFALLTAGLSASVGGTVDAATSADSTTPKFIGQKWTFQTKETGLFVSSPLVVENKVFAASAHPSFKGGTLYCFDVATGKENWQFIDDGDFKQVFSSPAFGDGKIFIGEGFHEDPACKLYCVDAKSGDKIWEFKTKSQTEATPAYADGKVFQGCGNDGFFCFAADAKDTGKILWQFPPMGSKGRLLRFGAGAAVSGGKVYAGTGVDRLQKDDKGETALFCLDASTGEQKWKVPMPQPVWGAPVVADSFLFVTTGNGDVFDDDAKPAGTVFCLNPENGQQIWKVDLPNGVLQKPAVDRTTVYVACRDGHCYAIDRVKGDIKWKYDLGSPAISTPALDASGPETSSVFAIGSRGKIVCLDPAKGTPFWSYNVTGKAMTFIAAPALAVRPSECGTQRLLVVGAGDARSGALATLICLEDRVTK